MAGFPWVFRYLRSTAGWLRHEEAADRRQPTEEGVKKEAAMTKKILLAADMTCPARRRSQIICLYRPTQGSFL